MFDSSFAPLLKVLCYKGDKARRAELQTEMNSHEFHVVITTYEVSGLCSDKFNVLFCKRLKRINCQQNSWIHSFVSKTLHSWEGKCVLTVLLEGGCRDAQIKVLHKCTFLSFLRLRWKWAVLVVDEAHRLKNPFSKLHQSLTEVKSCSLIMKPFCFSVLKLLSVLDPGAVLSRLQAPADRDTHSEQPAGTLRFTELHPAQDLQSW